MPPDSTEPRRYLIATAIAHYSKAPHWDRPGLQEARDQIIALFTEDLGYQHISTLGLDATKDQLTTQLRNFCRDKARQPTDIVAVYISGHGEVLDTTGEHVLLTTDVDPDDIADALRTAELARKMLLDTEVRRVLLMLDTCYSGHGGNELTAAAITSMTHNWSDDHGSGLAVITSAQPAEQAATGAFPQLLRAAVGNLPTAGYNPTTLPLDSIVKAMNASPDKPGYQTIGHSVTGLTGEVPPFLPNPRHDPRMTEVDLAIQHASEFDVQAERRDTELRNRLLVRAMGGHTAHSTQGWWFAGRHTALLDITTWLHQPDPTRPLQVVTGNPGSGKTAVLGLIAVLTHPDRRATVPLHNLGLPAAAVPDEGAVDVAIYAQGLTTEQVLAGIAAAVHSHANTPGQLLEELDDANRPLTVLIDAIDEATDPDHLTRRLLRPLVDHAAGKLRLLIGTRDFLLKRLGLSREDAIDLDAERYADLTALTTYAARGLLEATEDSPYRNEQPSLVRAVADAVAEAARSSFLVARITSASLAAQDHAADPRDASWRRALPQLPGEAMRRDLETRLGDNAAKVRDLLRPLAFAEGQGLPWEDIWAAVASRTAGITYTDEDLLWLRKQAGSYVVEATEDDRSTYRLFHQALADHLREHTDATATHRAITEVLMDRVPRTLDRSRDWARAHPYTLRYLASHAAHAGEIDTLVVDADFLVHAEPAGLLAALQRTSTDDGNLTAAVYRSSADIHQHLSPLRRRQVLAADAARFRASSLLHDLSLPLAWRPRWATGQQASYALHTTFTGHTAVIAGYSTWLYGVACSSLDDRPIAVTTGADRVARVWDLSTGEELTTFTDHATWLYGVDCSSLDGRPVAVTAGDDGTAQVWDLKTGETLTTLTGHTKSVTAVACSTLNGRPIAVTASDDGTARVWDLDTGKEHTAFTAHTGRLLGVACSNVSGRSVAVTASDDGTARVWDLDTGEELTTFTGHTSEVRVVACSTLNGEPIAVTGSRDGTARVWYLATGEEVTRFNSHTGAVWAVACGSLNGQPVAITTGDDRVARVWDVSTGEEVTTNFTRHADWLRAVACSCLGDRPVAVTAGDDGTAQVWWLMAETDGPSTSLGHSAEIAAVAGSVLGRRPVVVTAGDDRTARVWNLDTGETLTTFTRHTKSVTAVACSTLNDRPIAVTTSNDGTARVWDLDTGDGVAVFDFRKLGAVAVGHGGALMIAAAWDLIVVDRNPRY